MNREANVPSRIVTDEPSAPEPSRVTPFTEWLSSQRQSSPPPLRGRDRVGGDAVRDASGECTWPHPHPDPPPSRGRGRYGATATRTVCSALPARAVEAGAPRLHDALDAAGRLDLAH